MNQKGSAKIILVVIVIVLLGVVGYLALVRKSEPITQQTQTSSEISGWKTYQNGQYGLEVKYPENYSLAENDSGVSMQSSESCKKILGTGGGRWPKDCFTYDLLIQKNKIDGGSTHMPSINVAGYSSEKFELDGGMYDNLNQTYIQFEKNGNWYVSYVSYNSENKVIAENLLNQILSTFKFTK